MGKSQAAAIDYLRRPSLQPPAPAANLFLAVAQLRPVVLSRVEITPRERAEIRESFGLTMHPEQRCELLLHSELCLQPLYGYHNRLLSS